jgi:4-amino-4-deoxy-L-arabinose transferase-like glycosyltransferase
MPALQDVIHKIEVGEWTRYVKVGVALLGFLALAAVYDIWHFKGFSTPEAMDSAQLARNIARGKGFTTEFVRPLSLHLLQKHEQENGQTRRTPFLKQDHPDLANPPVYPLLLAGWMKALPSDYTIAKAHGFVRYQPEVFIACLNQVLFFAAVLLLFRLALRLFDQTVAWVSAFIFAATDLYWKFSVSGLSTMLLVLLFLLLVWCLVLLEENHREGARSQAWFITVGLVTGLLIGVGALTRYSFVWLLIPVIGFFVLYFGQRGAALCLSVLAGCAVLITPWVIRNYNLSGTPLGTTTYAIYQGTTPNPEFRGNKLERYYTGEFEAALAKIGVDQFTRKLLVNSAQIVRRDLLDLGGNWAAAFFLVGVMVPFLNPGLNRLRVFLLLCLGVLIAAQALGRGYLSSEDSEITSENLLVIMAPLAWVFGIAMFLLLLDQINLPFPPTRTLITAAFGIVVSAPLIFTLLPPRSSPIAYPPYWPPLVQDVSTWMKPEELMMSDMPWAVAWYGDRKCLWATLDAPSDMKLIKQSDFFDIHDYQKPIQGILLTRLTTDARWFSQMIQGQDYAWGKFMLECLLRTNVPSGFPLKYSPRGFLQEGLLFLSDRNRWDAPGTEEWKRRPH